MSLNEIDRKEIVKLRMEKARAIFITPARQFISTIEKLISLEQ